MGFNVVYPNSCDKLNPKNTAASNFFQRRKTPKTHSDFDICCLSCVNSQWLLINPPMKDKYNGPGARDTYCIPIGQLCVIPSFKSWNVVYLGILWQVVIFEMCDTSNLVENCDKTGQCAATSKYLRDLCKMPWRGTFNNVTETQQIFYLYENVCMHLIRRCVP